MKVIVHVQNSTPLSLSAPLLCPLNTDSSFFPHRNIFPFLICILLLFCRCTVVAAIYCAKCSKLHKANLIITLELLFPSSLSQVLNITTPFARFRCKNNFDDIAWKSIENATSWSRFRFVSVYEKVNLSKGSPRKQRKRCNHENLMQTERCLNPTMEKSHLIYWNVFTSRCLIPSMFMFGSHLVHFSLCQQLRKIPSLHCTEIPFLPHPRNLLSSTVHEHLSR